MAYRHSIHVEAPVEKVFGFFRDPGNWRSLQPEGVEFKDVRLTREGLGTHYRWAAKIAGFSIEGFDVFTEFIPNQRITDRSSSSLEGTWTYLFEPDGTGNEADRGEPRTLLLAHSAAGAAAGLDGGKDARAALCQGEGNT
jgi:hypothetical protein